MNIVNGTLTIGNYTYKSSGVVAYSRYGVLLGMPWHVFNNPNVYFDKRVVQVDELKLLGELYDEEYTPLEVTNLIVKNFLHMLSKSPSDSYKIYQLVCSNGVKGKQYEVIRIKDMKLAKILKRYEDLFQDDLPSGLPQKSSVDHEIEMEEERKPPHRSL